jgi:hypothetical protein
VERLAADPQAKRSVLIDEASRQFDLTPLEADFLYAKLIEATREPPSPPDDPRACRPP